MNAKELTINEHQILANKGDADAQWRLGHAYKWGRGIQRNFIYAFKWAELSADQGNSNGQWLLGTLYGDGHGIGRDYSKAFLCYKKSAEQGNSEGQHLLALCFEFGLGVDADEDQAEKWLLRAATQGDQWTQWYLGCFYVNRANDDEAYKWIRLSADQGNEEAKQYIYEHSDKQKIDDAPGKELLEKIAINLDYEALNDFFHKRLKWASGNPVIIDKGNYNAFTDLHHKITSYTKRRKLLQKATHIALKCKDQEFHMALGLMCVMIPFYKFSANKMIRERSFSDQLLRLRLRVEKLSFLPYLDSTWRELVQRQKNLYTEDDYLQEFSVEQLEVAKKSWTLYFPSPLVNYGLKLISELKISPKELCNIAFQDEGLAGRMELVFSTKLGESIYWVWRIPNHDGTALIADMIYLRQSDTEALNWGVWSLYLQFQERDDPISISARLMNIEYGSGGENSINL
jgi:hypothetical protein